VDAGHERGRERDRLTAVHQALIAVPEAEDPGHAVVLGQFQDQPADHVVQPGAQAAAGHDAGAQPGRVEVQVLTRAARLERGHRGRPAPAGDGHPGRVVEQHAVGLVHVVRRARAAAEQPGHRRRHRRLAQPGHRQAGLADGQLVARTHHAVLTMRRASRAQVSAA